MPLRDIYHASSVEQTFCSMGCVGCHSPCSPEGLSSARGKDKEAKNDRRTCKCLSKVCAKFIGRAPTTALDKSRIMDNFPEWLMPRLGEE